jgi:hypothetical protein
MHQPARRPWHLHIRQPPHPLHHPLRAIAMVVHPHHAVALGQQSKRSVRADVAGCAGEEDVRACGVHMFG